MGAKMMGAQPVFAVDKCPIAAHTYAKTYGFEVQSTEETFAMVRNGGSLPTHLVVVGDIEQVEVWIVATMMGVDTWMASPPCQPWSGSGYKQGLESPDGQVLPHFLLAAAQSGGR